jgi:hypothetical protein
LAVVERLCENEEAESETQGKSRAADPTEGPDVQEAQTDTSVPEYADTEQELVS